MVNKFIKPGQGEPVSYLLNNRWPAPVLLYGDPEIFLAMLKACTFKQKYTSSVIRFKEIVSEEIEREIIASHDEMEYAGLDSADFCHLWVRHIDKGSTELHKVRINQHISSGKQYTHYYDKSDRSLYESWQEITNYRYEFSSPNDSSLARLRNIPSNRLPADKKEVFRRLDDLIVEKIITGQVKNRDDIKEFLKFEGYEVSSNKTYLAVRPKGSKDKRLRLKGRKYQEGTDLQLLQTQSEAPESLRKSRDEYERIFAHCLQKRIERNQKRFAPSTTNETAANLAPKITDQRIINHERANHPSRDRQPNPYRSQEVRRELEVHQGAGEAEAGDFPAIFSGIRIAIGALKRKMAILQNTRQKANAATNPQYQPRNHFYEYFRNLLLHRERRRRTKARDEEAHKQTTIRQSATNRKSPDMGHDFSDDL